MKLGTKITIVIKTKLFMCTCDDLYVNFYRFEQKHFRDMRLKNKIVFIPIVKFVIN